MAVVGQKDAANPKREVIISDFSAALFPFMFFPANRDYADNSIYLHISVAYRNIVMLQTLNARMAANNQLKRVFTVFGKQHVVKAGESGNVNANADNDNRFNYFKWNVAVPEMLMQTNDHKITNPFQRGCPGVNAAHYEMRWKSVTADVVAVAAHAAGYGDYVKEWVFEGGNPWDSHRIIWNSAIRRGDGDGIDESEMGSGTAHDIEQQLRFENEIAKQIRDAERGNRDGGDTRTASAVVIEDLRRYQRQYRHQMSDVDMDGNNVVVRKSPDYSRDLYSHTAIELVIMLVITMLIGLVGGIFIGISMCSRKGNEKKKVDVQRNEVVVEDV